MKYFAVKDLITNIHEFNCNDVKIQSQVKVVLFFLVV